jgi:hypothetical protein
MINWIKYRPKWFKKLHFDNRSQYTMILKQIFMKKYWVLVIKFGIFKYRIFYITMRYFKFYQYFLIYFSILKSFWHNRWDLKIKISDDKFIKQQKAIKDIWWTYIKRILVNSQFSFPSNWEADISIEANTS